MVKGFWDDLSAAHNSELLVKNIFEQLTDVYTFEWVGNNREFFDKGDLVAYNTNTGKTSYIEIKLDSRIYDTKNVLCEDEVIFYDSGERRIGNIHNNFDVYVVVSYIGKKIYVLDGEALRANYQQGKYVTIHHEEQTTNAYLLSLYTLDDLDGVITVIDFEWEEKDDE